jgi:hypothetical protein
LNVGVIPTAITIIIVTLWVVHNIITITITNPILIITSIPVTNTSLTNNKFIKCFSRIYDFFCTKFYASFFRWLQSYFFWHDRQLLYLHFPISIENFYIEAKKNKENFVKRNSRFRNCENV